MHNLISESDYVTYSENFLTDVLMATLQTVKKTQETLHLMNTCL